jgi:hypothetical protein
VAATLVDAEGFGGHPTAGQSNYTTGWSLTAGNLVVVTEMVRARSGAPSISPTSADFAQEAATAADFNGVTAYLFVGTVDTTGAVTYTPAQSSGDRWSVTIAEVSDAAFLSATGQHQGPFDADISFVSGAMTGDDGLAYAAVHSDADGNIDLTAPTDVLFERPVSGFELSNAAAWAALDNTQTATLTGSIPGGGINIHHEFWALFEAAGGGGSPATLIPRITQSGLKLG